MDRIVKFLQAKLAEEALQENDEIGLVPSMTISRESGAGLDLIGPKLVDYLTDVDACTDTGWELFDQALIGKIIEEHHLPASVEPYLAENAKFSVVEVLEEALRLHPSQWSLFNYSADTIRRLCRMGNAIVVGRGGNFVCSDLENTFHVRLVGSLEQRVKNLSLRHEIPVDQAAELLASTDKGREKFIRRYANADISSPKFYHLVLNTDDFSMGAVARMLADSMLDWAQEKSVTETREN